MGPDLRAELAAAKRRDLYLRAASERSALAVPGRPAPLRARLGLGLIAAGVHLMKPHVDHPYAGSRPW